LNGAPWRIAVDAGARLDAARGEARGIEETFHRRFFVGAAIAALAALGIVFLVWQTERLARQRAQFAAAAAHELRTPLAGMQMYGEMLAEGLGDPRRAAEYARRIATEAARLGRVVANVLEFTRLERGRLKVHIERGDLAAVVREAVDRQRPALESAGLRVELTTDENLAPVAIDRDAVNRIVQNLLDNAEKYTRETADRKVRVSVAAGLVRVTDNGPGLPPEMKRRLFHPFARGNRPDAPAGLGLGLALVQALARAQGAEARYASAAEGGAEFIVSFPTQ
jgi:signal transduction histidine kinase